MTTDWSFGCAEYIDYENGVVRLDPMGLMNRLQSPWSINQKIDIFQCRTEVWQLGPAAQIIHQIEADHGPHSIWSHSAYAAISIFCSYFEVIGKILNPESQATWGTDKDFACGFRDVYPHYRKSNSDDNFEVNEFRDRVRNGIYHVALTKHGLRIHNDPSHSTQDYEVVPDPVNLRDKQYLVNPHLMIRTLTRHLPTMMERLRRAESTKDRLARKFEEVFDTFLIPQSQVPKKKP